jgi:hypothetical protein
MRKAWLLVMVPSIGFCDPCGLPQILSQIRPGAIWVVDGSTNKWLDAIQGQPLQPEIDSAVAA